LESGFFPHRLPRPGARTPRRSGRAPPWRTAAIEAADHQVSIFDALDFFYYPLGCRGAAGNGPVSLSGRIAASPPHPQGGSPVSRRIRFINPFGTTAYDALIHETLSHYCMEGTTLDVAHLEAVPADMDYFYPKHFVEMALFEAVKQAEEAGYDAVISGCCYDPGVRVARELTDLPVIGPMEASLQLLAYHGRTAVIVTDHVKACTLMKDNARLYGATDPHRRLRRHRLVRPRHGEGTPRRSPPTSSRSPAARSSGPAPKP
jgi:hypothetical protein